MGKDGKEQKILEKGFQGEMVLWQFSDVMIDAWTKIIDLYLDALVFIENVNVRLQFFVFFQTKLNFRLNYKHANM